MLEEFERLPAPLRELAKSAGKRLAGEIADLVAGDSGDLSPAAVAGLTEREMGALLSAMGGLAEAVSPGGGKAYGPAGRFLAQAVPRMLGTNAPDPIDVAVRLLKKQVGVDTGALSEGVESLLPEAARRFL